MMITDAGRVGAPNRFRGVVVEARMRGDWIRVTRLGDRVTPALPTGIPSATFGACLYSC
jgi:hypothetical protein